MLELEFFDYLQNSSDEKGDVGVLEQLHEMVAATKSILFDHVDEIQFRTNGFACDTLVLDSCEHALYQANETIDLCSAVERNNASASAFGDSNGVNKCMDSFLPRLDGLMDRLMVNFKQCLNMARITMNDDGMHAFMMSLKDGLVNIIQKRFAA